RLNRQTFRTENLSQCDSSTTKLSVPKKAIDLPQRAISQSQVECLQLMRDKQQELINEISRSSELPGTSKPVKPETPHLIPLGSPKGLITPLALEHGNEYFHSRGNAAVSPTTS
ncbi:uncharacterized protein A1O9_09567, partial [Exophiala aquamarina CBS 119918]